MEFEEKVLWKKKQADKQAKIRSRWAHGIFVGVRKRSGEMWVATKSGEIKSVRAVRRMPEEARWAKDSVGWIQREMARSQRVKRWRWKAIRKRRR